MRIEKQGNITVHFAEPVELIDVLDLEKDGIVLLLQDVDESDHMALHLSGTMAWRINRALNKYLAETKARNARRLTHGRRNGRNRLKSS